MNKPLRVCVLILIIFSAFFLGPDNASANDGAGGSEWDFSVTPYVWGSGLVGTVGAKGYKVHINLSFSDVLDQLNKSSMISFTGNKGKQFFIFDGMYLDISHSGATSKSDVFADIDVTTTRLQAAWGTNFLEGDSFVLSGFAGIRYWDITNRLTLHTTSEPLGTYKDSEAWLDPILGIRYEKSLTDKLSLLTMLDIGGLGVGSELTWGGMINIAWKYSERTYINLGYRYLYVDYENNGFIMDAYNDGIFAGITFRF